MNVDITIEKTLLTFGVVVPILILFDEGFTMAGEIIVDELTDIGCLIGWDVAKVKAIVGFDDLDCVLIVFIFGLWLDAGIKEQTGKVAETFAIIDACNLGMKYVRIEFSPMTASDMFW